METKAWYKSKGIWGAIVMIASLILGQITGNQVTEEEQTSLVNSLVGAAEGIGLLIGIALSIWGRLTASKKIIFVSPKVMVLGLFLGLGAATLLSGVMLPGCAGPAGPGFSARETTVVTYETVALGLNSAKAFIKGQEVSGQLKGAELDEVIAEWEAARQIFLKAGDALKESIGATDAKTTQEKMALYNALLQKAALELGKIKPK